MSTPFVGEVRIFAGNFAPVGYAFCAGQILAIAQNDVLFALIGTTYGGDGVTTFALPDLRGRVPVHQGPGPGLSSYVIGQSAGTETVMLTTTQIPAHSHGINAGAGGTKAASPAGAYLASGGSQHYASNRAASTGILQGGLAANAGGQPHTNTMPYAAVSYIIALFGIFPSPN